MRKGEGDGFLGNQELREERQQETCRQKRKGPSEDTDETTIEHKRIKNDKIKQNIKISENSGGQRR